MTEEKFEYKLDELDHRWTAIQEEFIVLLDAIQNIDEDTNLVQFKERLRDNMSNQKQILEEVRRLYKDYLNVEDNSGK